MQILQHDFTQTIITIRPIAKLILCYDGGLRFWYG